MLFSFSLVAFITHNYLLSAVLLTIEKFIFSMAKQKIHPMQLWNTV